MAEKDPDFQAVVRAERARRGMNRTAFAKLIGVSRQSLIAYEEVGQAPKLSLAACIAQRLGMTLDELAGITERPVLAQEPPRVIVDGIEYAPVSAANGADAESDASDPGPARPGPQPDRRPSEQTRKSPRAARRSQDE